MKKIFVLVCSVYLVATHNCIAQNVPDSKEAVVGHLKDSRLDEVSGIVASSIHTGTYYVHNDSGDNNRFFAITRSGDLKAIYYFVAKGKEYENVADCEDIAIGPGPEKGKTYIYLGDIGDNLGLRDHIAIYRFKENELPVSGTPTVVGKMTILRYPDGARDAETLMIDPINRYLYIISKREDSVGVYGCSLEAMEEDAVVLQRYARLFFPGKRREKQITAGDISIDGRRIILKSYAQVFYWKRAKGETLGKCLQRKPIIQSFQPDGQQEAITFDPDGKGYLVASEGKKSPIYYFPIISN